MSEESLVVSYQINFLGLVKCQRIYGTSLKLIFLAQASGRLLLKALVEESLKLEIVKQLVIVRTPWHNNHYDRTRGING